MKKFLTLVFSVFLLSRLTCAEISWSSPETISTSGVNSSSPNVVIDQSGNATAIWVQNGVVVSKSKPYGGSWGTATSLSGAGGSSPRLAIDSSGNIVAVWLESNVIKSANRPSGGSWGSATTLSNTGASAPAVTIDVNGNAAAVWARNGFIESASKLFAGLWGLVTVLSGSASDSPLIASDSSGNTIAVWHTLNGSVHQIFYARKLLAGLWGTATLISQSTKNSVNPALIMDSSGNAIASWFRYDTSVLSGNTVYSNVILQAAYYTAGGSWSSPLDISSGGVENPNNLFNRARFDASGNALLVWNNSFDGTTFNIQSAVRQISGKWFGPDDIVVGNLYAYDQSPSVISIGDSVVLFMFFDAGSNSVLVQSSQSDIKGVFPNAWSIPINVSNSGTNNSSPRVSASLNGTQINATGVWVNYDGSNTVIQASSGTKEVLDPPSNLAVNQGTNSYGVFNEYYNTITWDASPDPDVIGYRIYRNGVFLDAVDEFTLQYVDHNAVQSGSVTYGVSSFNTAEDESPVSSVNYP